MSSAPGKVALFLGLLGVLSCAQGEKREFLGPPETGKSPTSIVISPRIGVVETGQAIRFAAYGRAANGDSVGVDIDWAATGGNIGPDGLFQADEAGSFRVVARSHQAAQLADSAIVSVNSPDAWVASLEVSPATIRVGIGGEVRFSALARLANGTAVQAPIYWTTNGGQITSDGTFTAGQSVGRWIVIAVAGEGVADTAVVDVTARPILTTLEISPKASTVDPGGMQQYVVGGSWSDGSTTPPDVDFSSTGGTIDASGRFLAGTTIGDFKVVARKRGGTTSDTATVRISGPKPTGITIAPDPISLAPGATEVFTATAHYTDGSLGPVAVSWSASGGQITSNGAFTAGSQAGTYRVIAQLTSANLADTATVTIGAPSATLTSLVLNPSTVTVPAGGTYQFSVAASWSDGSSALPPVVWSATGGTVGGSGLFTAGSAPGTYRVVARHQGGTLADTSVVTVGAPVLIGLSISPASANVDVGKSLQFTVTAQWSDGGTALPSMTFAATGGSVTGTGLFTAGAVAGTGRIIVTAANGRADTALVNMVTPLATLSSIALTPTSASVTVGQSRRFTTVGTMSDGSTSNPAVTFSATGGTIDASGNYVAGSTTGTFRVIARQQGGTLADTSAVQVQPLAPVLIGLALTPAGDTVQAGQTLQFSTVGIWSNGGNGTPDVVYAATGGTITATGLYQAGTTSGTYQVVVRVKGGSIADTARVTVASAPGVLTGVSLRPENATLAVGATKQFSVVGLWSNGGTGSPAVTYAATGGTISGGGLYTAGSVAGTYRVIATVVGGTMADTAAVVVTATGATLTGLTLSPASLTIQTGAQQAFTVAARWSDGSTSLPAVVYRATGGTISAAGLFKAGSVAGAFQVIVSDQGGTIADTAAVTIVTPVVTGITMSPKSSSLQTSASLQYAVSGTWSDGVTRPVAVSYSASGGTISVNGLYTAGQLAGAFLAVANCGCGVADTASVSITTVSTTVHATAISLSPSTVTLAPSASQSFSASVTWSDASSHPYVITYAASGGTVSPSGVYTAPATAGTYQVVATCDCGLTDTASVSVATSAPVQATAMNLTPSIVTLPASASQSFSVAVTWSDALSHPFVITYSASGGTVSQSGVYIAPAAAGTYQLVATCDCGLTDTASVTVSSSVLQGNLALMPNLPQGFTTLIDHSFPSIKDNWVHNQLWFDPTRARIIGTDPTAPKSTADVLEITYPMGSTDITPVPLAWQSFGGVRTAIYIATWVKFSRPWQYHTTGVNKIYYVGTNGSSTVDNEMVVALKGTSESNADIMVAVQTPANNGAGTKNGYYLPNMATPGFALGMWHRIEVLAVQSTNGIANGTLQWWVDGVLVGLHTNVNFTAVATGSNFDSMKFHPIWGGQGAPPKAEDDFLWIDHVVVAGR